VKRQSISLRLKRAGRQSTAREILAGWRESWDYDMRQTVQKLRVAIEQEDLDAIDRITSTLLPLTRKRLAAIENIGEILMTKRWLAEHEDKD
jgi:hypothetical protein